MVDIYKVGVSEDGFALHIWIPADKIPLVPFIEEQLASQEIALLARQIVTTHKVRITYSDNDIPTLLRHLEETYSYTVPQIRDIILWCGERIPQGMCMCLELLKRART